MFIAFARVLFVASALWSGLLFAAADVHSASQRSFTHTIFLVRHGAYDEGAKVDERVGGSLTPLGIAEARLIASRLRSIPVHFDSITSSAMMRAEETAAVIGQALEMPVQHSSALSECLPPAFRAFPEETAEKQAECAKGLDQVFAKRFGVAKGRDSNDLVVAHGNVIRYFVTKALRVDTRAWLGMSIAHASLTIIRVRGDGTMSVIAVGDMGHLPPGLQSWGTADDPQLTQPEVK